MLESPRRVVDAAQRFARDVSADRRLLRLATKKRDHAIRARTPLASVVHPPVAR
jgi:hypothetical protein